MKFYISDLHIGHKNILKFDNRPFTSLEEMEKTIINNWNGVVKKNDEIYILGDMFWHNENAVEVLKQLNGRKYLITGNHDRVNSEMSKYFIWQKKLETISDCGTKLVLCHYPIAHWEGQFHNPKTIHLYGHIHKGRDSRPFEEYIKFIEDTYGDKPICINVGCMMEYMNYTPKTLEQLMRSLNV